MAGLPTEPSQWTGRSPWDLGQHGQETMGPWLRRGQETRAERRVASCQRQEAGAGEELAADCAYEADRTEATCNFHPWHQRSSAAKLACPPVAQRPLR